MPDSCQSLRTAADDALRPGRLPVGQIPDEVRLDDVALQSLVLHQVVEHRLIVADEERPVGVVLQAQRHAGRAVVAEAERVVPAERHAVAEAPGRRELHRVVGPVERLPLLIDVGVAADRPQQLLHIGARAGNAGHGGAAGRILILRLERRAEINRVDVHRRQRLERVQHVEGVLPDVGDVERRRPGQRHLHAGVPLPATRAGAGCRSGS